MAQTTVEPGPPVQDRPVAGVVGLAGAGAAVAALVAAGPTGPVNGPLVVVPGLTDPGRLVTAGLPAVRAVAEVAMVLTIGAMLLAAFLVPPQRSGYLDVAGYRGVRAAAAAALAWAVASALMVPLSVADALGRPLGDVLDVGLLVQAVPRLTTATAWTLTTVVALLVLAGSRTVLSWGWTAVVFGVALLGPLPVALTGHSATGGSHDVASDSLVLHVLAASLWVGGLVAGRGRAPPRGAGPAPPPPPGGPPSPPPGGGQRPPAAGGAAGRGRRRPRPRRRRSRRAASPSSPRRRRRPGTGPPRGPPRPGRDRSPRRPRPR